MTQLIKYYKNMNKEKLLKKLIKVKDEILKTLYKHSHVYVQTYIYLVKWGGLVFASYW